MACGRMAHEGKMIVGVVVGVGVGVVVITLPRSPPPLLAWPSPLPVAGKTIYVPGGLPARSGLPACLSSPDPAKRKNPPKGHTRRRRGRVSGAWVYMLTGTRANKSEQS